MVVLWVRWVVLWVRRWVVLWRRWVVLGVVLFVLCLPRLALDPLQRENDHRITET